MLKKIKPLLLTCKAGYTVKRYFTKKYIHYQANADATIKRIYQFSVAGSTPQVNPTIRTTPDFPVVAKTLLRDLMTDLRKTNDLIREKIKGLTVTADGDLYIVNDDVDDSNGETQLLKIDDANDNY